MNEIIFYFLKDEISWLMHKLSLLLDFDYVFNCGLLSKRLQSYSIGDLVFFIGK